MSKSNQKYNGSSQVVQKKQNLAASEQVATGRFFLENSYLRVTVNPQGWITVEDKKQRQIYPNLHVFEVTDISKQIDKSHVPSKKTLSRLINSLRISLIETGPKKGAIRIRVRMKVKAELGGGPDQKYPRKRNVKIWTTVCLSSSSHCVEFKTRVETDPISRDVNVLLSTGCKTSQLIRQAKQTVQIQDGKRHLILNTTNPLKAELRLDNHRTLAFCLIPARKKMIPSKTFAYTLDFSPTTPK